MLGSCGVSFPHDETTNKADGLTKDSQEDPRGGLTSALNELAERSRKKLLIDESHIPVQEPVRGACEVLGIDPLYVANEGRFELSVALTELEWLVGKE